MKTRSVRIKETVDRRYFGAVRFVNNATGSVVRRPMNINAPGLRFIINLSQLHVITHAEGLENHLYAFKQAPDQPPAHSKEFHMTITDPLKAYLPRKKTIELPRNPLSDDDDNVFEAIDISLYSASASRLSSNWSIIRASVYDVKDMDQEIPVRGALLRIIKEDGNKLIASGLSDQRGEALIIVPGIPITNFVTAEEPHPDGGDVIDIPDNEEWLASGEVLEKETPVKLQVVVKEETPWPIDPEELEKKHNSWRRKLKKEQNGQLKNHVKLKLKTGQTQAIKLFVKVPNGA